MRKRIFDQHFNQTFPIQSTTTKWKAQKGIPFKLLMQRLNQKQYEKCDIFLKRDAKKTNETFQIC